MTIKVPEETSDSIVEDRKSGSTYAELQKKYNLTQRVIRRICEGVHSERKMNRIEAIDKIYLLAARPEGAKFEDYYSILAALFGYKENTKEIDMTAQDLSYLKARVKDKAKREKKEIALIPSWLDRNLPKVSQSNMLMAATSLFENLQENIDFYVQQHPEMDTPNGRKSVERELLNLAVQGYYHRGVESRCEYISECVEYLIDKGIKNE